MQTSRVKAWLEARDADRILGDFDAVGQLTDERRAALAAKDPAAAERDALFRALFIARHGVAPPQSSGASNRY